MSSFFFTIRCNIDKDDLKKYINYTVEKHNIKLSKKILPIIYSCNDLYYINMLLEFKSLKPYDPLQKYIEQIYSIIKKYNTILFLENIRPILYEVYLLNFNLSKMIRKFISFVQTKNKHIDDSTLHIIYHLAAVYDPSQPEYFQPFSLIETFFIEIKKLNICV